MSATPLPCPPALPVAAEWFDIVPRAHQIVQIREAWPELITLLHPALSMPRAGIVPGSAALAATGFVPANAMRGTAVSRTLVDGDVLDLGDRQLQVLHVPGDTPGHIVLYEIATGTLFTGDTLFDDPEPLSRGRYRAPRALPDERARRQRRLNLERIARLNVSTVCAGHFEPFNAARLRTLLAGMLQN